MSQARENFLREHIPQCYHYLLDISVEKIIAMSAATSLNERDMFSREVSQFPVGAHVKLNEAFNFGNNPGETRTYKSGNTVVTLMGIVNGVFEVIEKKTIESKPEQKGEHDDTHTPDA